MSLIPDEISWYELSQFWRRLYLDEPADGSAQWLLALSATEPRENVANCIFRETVGFRTWRNRPDAPTLEELLDYVQRYPRFADSLHQELYCLIPAWRWKQAQHRAERCQQQQAIRDEIEREFGPHLDKIRAGTAIDPLVYFAKVYFGLFVETNRDLDPVDRLRDFTNATFAEAALEGFVAALQNMAIPSPREIGAVCARSKYKP